uniref:TIR domain-containing protein n=1 Tax=Hemiselmis andersenii TaxID=464988 RepID=A0A6U5CPT8_HEMAN|mmetsp:Transcript_9666/g.23624  ORF Transcript_9666/g.23624 Transcript_9666/m.23624 type:complete len:129 (+) Transcript_9666:330-716(+)
MMAMLFAADYEVVEVATEHGMMPMERQVALLKESSLVVVILSEDYFESKYCAAEARAAHQSGKRVVPVFDTAGDLGKNAVMKLKDRISDADTRAAADYIYSRQLKVFNSEGKFKEEQPKLLEMCRLAQ